MKRILKWLVRVALAFLLLLSVGLWALQHWFGTDDFKVRAEREASTALGVAVTLERLDVALWPLPAVALQGLQIQTQPVLTLERLEVRPVWPALLLGRLELATVVVRRAVLAQTALDALVVMLQKKKQSTQAAQELEPENKQDMSYIPRRLLLEELTWVSAKRTRITLDLEAQLSPHGLPDDVSIKVLKGQLQGARAHLQRQDHDWTLAMTVGGGTLNGHFALQPAARPGAEFVLKGQLQTRAVEVAALSSNPRSRLMGAPCSSVIWWPVPGC